MKKSTILIAILLSISIMLAGCGGSNSNDAADEGNSADSTTATTGNTESTDADASDADSSDSATESADEESTEESETETASDTESNSESDTASDSEQTTEERVIMVQSGELTYNVIEEGTGVQPQSGDIVSVHYTGMLEDGTVFDSSHNRGQPFTFGLGQGQVIQGWDMGIALMKVGGKAELIIPSDLGYGERGAGGVIPPNATLIFEVELMDVQPGPPAAPTEVAEGDYTETESGLKYYDFEEGEGELAQAGQTVSVHYTGWLQQGGMFDSSLSRGQPIQFRLGQGQVIPGWDEGLSTMKPGGKRQLVIPPELAYGDGGYGNVIPGGSTLIFEVELISAQ